MFNFIKKIFQKKELSDAEKAVDDYIKNTIKENQDALRFSSKMQKAQFIKMQTAEILKGLQEAKVSESEDNTPLEEKIMMMFLSNMFTPKGQIPQETGGSFQDPFINSPISPVKALPQDPKELMKLADELRLSEKQIKILKQKNLI